FGVKRNGIMRNQKGFTLTEILVVIVIIGVIMSIAIPAAIAISNSIKERTYNAKMEVYVTAAEAYAKNNSDIFGESTVIQISVETLLAYGYVDEEYSCDREYGCVEDPREKDSIMNDEPITIKKNKTIFIARSGPMEVELSLSFLTNGATSISATAVGCETLNGSSCEVTLPTIIRDGYTILGWNKASSGTTATYAPGETISIYEDGTYYAITGKTMSLTFDKNTAPSISSTTASCTFYNTQTSCFITSPTITPTSGYYALGWNTNSAATTKQYDSGGLIPMSPTVTYYAIQKIISYVQ
ncbi:MAG: prepilin-type N-terminal cleavage/methylation domain-containing protein, partial [Clostridia bacterium]|nr:prepilin-type N-terminal cleavage/methylation domain-containing protein [Clostridia bacterium]